MKSVTTSRFRRSFDKLPDQIQVKARKAYKLWVEDPLNPGLHFKQVHTREEIYSVRIDYRYRALEFERTTQWCGFG